MLEFYDNLTDESTIIYNHIQDILSTTESPPLTSTESNAIILAHPSPFSPTSAEMETIVRLPRFDLALRHLARPVRAYFSQRVENYSLKRTTSVTSREYSQASMMDTYDARF
jgi:hypothetical protein